MGTEVTACGFGALFLWGGCEETRRYFTSFRMMAWGAGAPGHFHLYT